MTRLAPACAVQMTSLFANCPSANVGYPHVHTLQSSAFLDRACALQPGDRRGSGPREGGLRGDAPSYFCPLTPTCVWCNGANESAESECGQVDNCSTCPSSKSAPETQASLDTSLARTHCGFDLILFVSAGTCGTSLASCSARHATCSGGEASSSGSAATTLPARPCTRHHSKQVRMHLTLGRRLRPWC